MHEHADKIEALERENARLREALQNFVGCMPTITDILREPQSVARMTSTTWASVLDERTLTARAALKGD